MSLNHLEAASSETPENNEYTVQLTVRLSSTLSAAELKSQLVLALWDEDTEDLTPDNASARLETIEYEQIEITGSNEND